MNTHSETILLSLGGSLMVPDRLDTAYVQSFVACVERHLIEGKRFIIVTGGGKVCRRYQEGLRTIRSTVSQADIDWMGIFVTRLNAELLRLSFTEAYPSVITDPHDVSTINNALVICGGWKPGWSTDYVTVMIAKTLGASRIANLSNIDYVYDVDPRENPNAKKYTHLTWDEYLNLIPQNWSPGMNTPFDPIASRQACDQGLTVAIINGKQLNQLDAFIQKNDFKGTKISLT